MTEKEAKKELYSYLHSQMLEERKLEQIEKKKAQLTKITSVLSDLPKGSYYEDKMAKNVADLLELVKEHIEIMIEEEGNLIRIKNKIKLVKQPYRNILELRFVEGLKIEAVSVEIDKTYRYTKTLIKNSIKEYASL